jgi:hypothetical protein
MAQFDVHRNIGKQSVAIPYVVIVQSSLFDSYRRRVVIPLVRRSNLDNASALVGSSNKSGAAPAGNRIRRNRSARRKSRDTCKRRRPHHRRDG